MSTQLDILALEPFYGGIRRLMLETIIRCSRHRWTLLKLPPRRIERRLEAAAHWFSEQLSRHWVGRTDVLFTSEAMNLPDLIRLTPTLAQKPSVVYFHSNQLPDIHATSESSFELVNLSTTAAATEVWFNSMYHLKDFLSRANALVERHPELSSRNPLPKLTGKAQVIAPPIETSLINQVQSAEKIERKSRTIFVDTRDADTALLNEALDILSRRGVPYSLITVGPVESLSPHLPRRTIPENDDIAQIRALRESEIILSTKMGATCDHYAIIAIAAGCWPLLPKSGVYPEILPAPLHTSCLYEANAEHLANRIMDVWDLSRPDGYERHLAQALHRFDAISACRVIDERLEHLAVMHGI